MLRSFIGHFGGLISHRVPLRSEFLPFLFSGSIRCAFGAFPATNRFQVKFLGQSELGDALIGGHFAAPSKGAAMTQFIILQCAALLNIAQLRGDG
jgi:hypothetical protein